MIFTHKKVILSLLFCLPDSIFKRLIKTNPCFNNIILDCGVMNLLKLAGGDSFGDFLLKGRVSIYMQEKIWDSV
jgi:hypothetical protein